MTTRTAALIASDVHYGKETSTYSCDVTTERLAAVSEQLTKLAKLSGPVDELVVVFLGDIVDGAGIYPTQAHHQEETDILSQVRPVASQLAGLVTAQTRHWPAVRVEAVAGNHGRSGYFLHEHTNWDVATYMVMELMLERDGVRVNYGQHEHSPFMRSVPIGAQHAMLYHGHGIRMYQQIPRYGIIQRLLKWSTASSLGDWRYLMLGHFHTLEYFQHNAKRVYLTGTMVSDDEWALEQLGADSTPAWWFLLFDGDGIVEWQYIVRM